MRNCLASVCTLCVWAAAVLPVSAGWDNVFQPTLFGRSRPANSSPSYYYAPPVVVQSSPIVAYASPCNTCTPCAPQCSTSYVQRSYYQPVTTYENKTVMEKVTSYRTSYYYEPVTSYRYTAYYDPCTGCSQQVAVPTTAYQLRSQNCPVESWVSRCVQVPVQAYQKVDYWQPQTTCCTTTPGTPIIATAPPIQTPAPAVAPAPSIPPYDDRPGVQGSKTQGMVNPRDRMELYYPKVEKVPEMPSIPGTSWQPKLGAPVPVEPSTPVPAKLDRVVVGPNSMVEGVVVRNDSSPKANAKLLFINAGTGSRQTITANTAGRFQAELPAGSWHVYVHGTDDIPVHHSRIDVNGAQTREVHLVSRSN